ncbi:MAG TPA: hypothetical protein VHO69_02090 [Phototrophicaceae bacterium]|nr:hypothetical protein [Phototrophicaceae bacterium]
MIKKIRDTITGLWPVIKPYIPKPRLIIVIVVAFLVGLFWGYVLDPTRFYDTDPSQLGQGWQDQWVQLIAANYAQQTANAAPTEQLNQNTIILLRAVDNPQEIVNRLGLVDISALAAQAGAGTPADTPTLFAQIRPWILGTIVVALVVLFSPIVYGFYISSLVVEPIQRFIKQRRGGGPAAGAGAVVTNIKQSRELAQKLAKEEAAAPTTNYGPPVTRHVSMYFPGRSFDDSFAIEDASNDDEFLGECGAVISETIGVGDQQKVTAVEIWLFDKDDFVRTLTGVFASENAYNDPATRSKLDPKGPVILAQPGAIIPLETNALRLQARVVDITYGTGPLPANSYFDKITIELLAWRKDATAASAGQPLPTAIPVAAPLPTAQPAYAPPTTAAPVFTPPTMPSAPLPTSTYTPPAPTSMPATTPPPAAPNYGAGVAPIKPPPIQPPPAQTPRRQDDDPFSGTGDWTPVN